MDAVIIRLARVRLLAAFQLGGIERTAPVGRQRERIDTFAHGPICVVVGIPHCAAAGRGGARRGRRQGGDASGGSARTSGLTQVDGATALSSAKVGGGITAGTLSTVSTLPPGCVDRMPVLHCGAVRNPVELAPVLLGQMMIG